MKILLATHNQHKFFEIKAMLDHLPLALISLKDINDTDEVAETGTTFHENAFLKASYYANKYQIPVIADDSGLIVDALNNQPGIFSARFAGENATDEENNIKLLEVLQQTKQRNGHFVCVICFILNQTPYYFEGKLHGYIANDMQSDHGFGYDAVFLSLEGKRLSDMLPQEKNSISHRFIAVNAMAQFLKSNINLLS